MVRALIGSNTNRRMQRARSTYSLSLPAAAAYPRHSSLGTRHSTSSAHPPRRISAITAPPRLAPSGMVHQHHHHQQPLAPRPEEATPSLPTTHLLKLDPASITFTTSPDPALSLEDPIYTTSSPTTAAILDQAAQLLTAGSLVAIPTETVYGLAANALDQNAVRGIFLAKNRPADNPLILHVSSLRMLRGILPGGRIPPAYLPILTRFWPGPLTILVPRSNLIPEIVCAGQPAAAVRFPANPVARALISRCGVPLAAPSANSSGKPSPTLASHVISDLNHRIPLVLDGGQCTLGIESTVVDGLRDPPVILRPGNVSAEDLRAVGGVWAGVRVYGKDGVREAETEERPSTPGMKYRHYSPRADVVLYEVDGNREPFAAVVLREINALRTAGKKRFGVLSTETDSEGMKTSGVETGQFEGDVEVVCYHLGKRVADAARELFKGLRYLDEEKRVEVIFVEGVKEEGEGLAVMNRVRKAASRVVFG